MATLVLGSFGALAGSPFGALGSRIGWMIGAAIGESFTHGQNGPRLTDLRVQASTYGKMITILYGTTRGAGNLIWSTPKQEHTQHHGGKGGPQYDTYSYTVSCAISLGEGTILGVRKIWANGKLIYNLSSSVDANTVIASGEAIANGMVVYLGDETQLPDPTIESYLGVGNVPAYRGQAYLVLTDFDLSPYGNQMPNFEFETVRIGSTSGYARTFLQDSIAVLDEPDHTFSFDDYLEQPDLSQGVLAARIHGYKMFYSMDGQYLGAQPATTYNYEGKNKFIGNRLGDQYVWFAADSSVSLGYLYAGPDPTQTGILLAQRHDTTRDDYFGGFCVTPDGKRAYVILQHPDGTAYLRIYDADLNIISELAQTALNPTKGGGYAPIIPGYIESITVESDYRHLWLSYTNVHRFVKLYYIEDNGSLTLLHAFNVNPTDTGPIGSYSIISADQGICAVLGLNNSTSGSPITIYHTMGLAVYTRAPLIAAQSEVLSDIVTDLCERVGMTAAQIDVSQLTDSVDGYRIDNQMSARAAIEQLMLAYQFDAVETGA